jgi:tubulin polyglutamylase TTLL1
LGEKKFDMRTYVLVTSYKPLKIYRYNKGFCRFCFENYQHLTKNVENPEEVLYSHLTNVSFQKNSDKYNSIHGGKWQLETFRLYMELNYGLEQTNDLFEQFDNIYIASLKSVQSVMCNDKHCFELYGFDLMIDDDFKVWLIEINASPSLSTTTKEDKKMKKSLMNDLLNVVMPHNWLNDKRNTGSATCKQTKIGEFDLLYDETRDPTVQKHKSRFDLKGKKPIFKKYF